MKVRGLWVLAAAIHLMAGPILQVDRRTVELGSLTPLSSHQLRFRMENTGDAPLRILDIRTDCGCTTCTIGSRVLMPGDHTSLEVRLEAGPAEGAFEKRITLTTNATGEATLDLRLTGEVRSQVEVDPPVLQFSEVSRSRNAITRSLHLSSGFPLAIAVKDPPGEGVFTWYVTTDSPRRAELHVTLDPARCPSDKRSGNFTLRLETGHQEQPILEVPVFWSLLTPFRINRGALALTPHSRHGVVTLSRTDGSEFTIIGILADTSYLVVTGNVKTATPMFRATIRAKVRRFPAQATTLPVGFTTEDPDEPVVWVRVTLAGD